MHKLPESYRAVNYSTALRDGDLRASTLNQIARVLNLLEGRNGEGWANSLFFPWPGAAREFDAVHGIVTRVIDLGTDNHSLLHSITGIGPRVAGAKPRRRAEPFPVTLEGARGESTLGAQPHEHEAFIREGLGATHRIDARTLQVLGQVTDDDPFHDGDVGIVAMEKLEVFRSSVGGVAAPSPVIRTVHSHHGINVSPVGERDTFAALSPTDPEGPECVFARRPRRGGSHESDEILLADSPVAGDVLRAECGDLLFDGLFEGVLGVDFHGKLLWGLGEKEYNAGCVGS